MAPQHDNKRAPWLARDVALANQDDSFWSTVTQKHANNQAPLPAQEAVPKSEGNSFWPPEIILDLQRRRTILVVSDKSIIYKFIQKALQKDHIRVILVGSDHALILAALAKEEPGLILLDDGLLRTPEGYQTCQAIYNNEQSRHIPMVMLLAARTNPFDRARARLVGVSDYLTKPFNSDALRTLVGKYLAIE